MATSVLVKQQVVITPSHPTPNHILQLSALDSQLFLRLTVATLLVYKPSNGVDRASITNNVKSALGRVLVPYYPLAGRVRSRADGSGLEVDCRAQGALFIDAVSNSTFYELVRAPKRTDQWREFLSLHVVDVLEGPPLVVQLTWLSDGGAALAVGISHCLCDGTGFGQFLSSVGQLAMGDRGLDELNPKPVWSRHLLGPMSSESTCVSSLNHPEFRSVADISGFTTRYAQEQLIPTSMIFDKNKLNELKKSTKSRPTSFDVLSAHVWRSWAKALNLPSNQIVKLIFTVNIRQRVNPNLPSGYYGNAFVFGCAETSVGDLTVKGLGYAMKLVMRAKERVGDGYVREVVELVSWNRYCVDSVCTLIMTQWVRHGVDIDFGIVKPVHVGPVCPGKICRLVLVSSVPTLIQVSIAIPSSVVAQYLYFLENIYAKI
ncbi:hypothetical protein ACS0TY_001038 [Phlomoides rotata]